PAAEELADALVTEPEAEVGADVSVQPGRPADSADLLQLGVNERIAHVVKGHGHRPALGLPHEPGEILDRHHLRPELLILKQVIAGGARIGMNTEGTPEIACGRDVDLKEDWQSPHFFVFESELGAAYREIRELAWRGVVQEPAIAPADVARHIGQMS